MNSILVVNFKKLKQESIFSCLNLIALEVLLHLILYVFKS